MELSLENMNWKLVAGVVGLVVILVTLFLLLRNKDSFCRCNSIGSRVICEDKEESNRKYVEGSLTENNFY